MPALARAQVAITRGERLFIKNTNHRRAETLSTMVDACSLPVPERRVQPEEGLVKSGGNFGFRLRVLRFGIETLYSDPLNGGAELLYRRQVA